MQKVTDYGQSMERERQTTQNMQSVSEMINTKDNLQNQIEIVKGEKTELTDRVTNANE